MSEDKASSEDFAYKFSVSFDDLGEDFWDGENGESTEESVGNPATTGESECSEESGVSRGSEEGNPTTPESDPITHEGNPTTLEKNNTLFHTTTLKSIVKTDPYGDDKLVGLIPPKPLAFRWLNSAQEIDDWNSFKELYENYLLTDDAQAALNYIATLALKVSKDKGKVGVVCNCIEKEHCIRSLIFAELQRRGIESYSL